MKYAKLNKLSFFLREGLQQATPPAVALTSA